MRTCANPECDKEIVSGPQNKLYCSRICWRRDYFRKTYQPKPRHLAICVRCKQEFSTSFRRPDQRFCSRQCEWKVNSAKRRAKKRPSPQVDYCLACGGLIPERSNYTKRFCSRQCEILDYSWRSRGKPRHGDKVRWQWQPGVVLAGKVQFRRGKMATVLVAGSLHEVPLKQLERIT